VEIDRGCQVISGLGFFSLQWTPAFSRSSAHLFCFSLQGIFFAGHLFCLQCVPRGPPHYTDFIFNKESSIFTQCSTEV